MTAAQIIADCVEHKIPLSINHMPVPEDGARNWCARIGDLKNMRLRTTFEAAVLAAWAAYTGEDRA